jgi:hypothetical protein
MARLRANHLLIKQGTVATSFSEKYIQGSKTEARSASALADKHDLYPCIGVLISKICIDKVLILN